VLRPLDRHRLGEHLQATLRRRVVADGRTHDVAHHGADIDDFPGLPRDHARRHGARDEEGAGEIRVEHLAPLRLGHLRERRTALDPRVVHEDVDRGEVLFDLLDRGGDRVALADIEGRGADARAGDLDPQRLGGGSEFLFVTAVEHDGRPGLREPARNREAEALTGTGDERGAPGEIEEGVWRGHVPTLNAQLSTFNARVRPTA
jgi:hypothetical protein